MLYSIYLLLFMHTSTLLLYQFNKSSTTESWEIINDNVMGGVSRGSLTLNSEGYGVFKGKVSIENNGGFSLIRYRTGAVNTNGYTKVCIHLKGDGKRYQFRIKSDQQDQHTYVHYFQTSGDWETIELPLSEFYPVFRGQKLDIANFSAKSIGEIGFLIGNKQTEDFRLIIHKIELK